MHVVGGGRVEGRVDAGEGAVSIMVAQGRFFLGLFGGWFEFEPGRQAREEAAKGFEVRSYCARLLLARHRFDWHLAAESALLEGLEDGFGDEFYLLDPVGAVLLRCWGVIGGKDLRREGRRCSCGEAAEKEAAAIGSCCFTCRHGAPVTVRFFMRHDFRPFESFARV